ncbi:hypothetical protein SSAG_05625 [Streptomyces sp. Mg1]|nr:hypothetical protein SSAG_05625 [Streptomyces sp. Mg1]
MSYRAVSPMWILEHNARTAREPVPGGCDISHPLLPGEGRVT